MASYDLVDRIGKRKTLQPRMTLAIVAAGLMVSFGIRSLLAQEPKPYAGPIAPLTAAVWAEQTDRVESLLAAGEDPNKPDGAQKVTPWQMAVLAGHHASLERFDRQGGRPDADYSRLLFKLVLQRGDLSLVRDFVRAGASQDFGREQYNALMVASASGDIDIMRALLDASSTIINAQDSFGDTALMAAVRSGRVEAVRLLLSRGANVALADDDGRTAMAWAMRTEREDMVRVLRDAGAATIVAATGSSPFPPRHAAASASAAVERSLSLLQRGGAEWNKQQKCAACHHHPVLISTTSLAKRYGFAIDATQAGEQDRRLQDFFLGFAGSMKAGTTSDDEMVRQSLGFAGTVPYATALMIGARLDSGVPLLDADATGALLLARMQLRDGRWHAGVLRVPIEANDLGTTAMVTRALRGFAAKNCEIAASLARARAWLRNSKPESALDHAWRVLGLRWSADTPMSDIDSGALRAAVAALKRQQHKDGGWSQRSWMNSDAFTAGVALVALHDAGQPVSSSAYRRGVDYLLRTQEDDGSWLVPKRSASLNRYFESGFPHGKHQFLSFAGTGWATMALMHAAGPQANRRTESTAAAVMPAPASR